MLSYAISKAILEAFLNTNWGTSEDGTTNPAKGNSGSVSGGGTFRSLIPVNVYLAFGRKTDPSSPLSVTSAGTLSNFTEISHTASNGYTRICLTDYSVTGNKKLVSLASPLKQDVTIQTYTSDGTQTRQPQGTDAKRDVACVQDSTEYIFGNYTGDSGEQDSGWGSDPVTCFAIFPSSTLNSMSGVIFYGELASPVTVGADKVPVIKPNGFAVTLG